MHPILLTLGPLTISASSFFAALGFLVASFFFWRKLREDYLEDDILSFTIFLVVGTILGARLFYLAENPDLYFMPLKWFALRFEPGFSFLGAVLAIIFILYFWSKKKNWDFWVVADIVTEGLFLFMVIFGVGLILSVEEKIALWFWVLSIFLLVLSFIFAANYRRFIWYKSGKPGFVASLILAIFSFGLFLLEIIFQKGVYLERVGFFVLIFGGLFFWYRRSERSLKEDIKEVFGIFRKFRKK